MCGESQDQGQRLEWDRHTKLAVSLSLTDVLRAVGAGDIDTASLIPVDTQLPGGDLRADLAYVTPLQQLPGRPAGRIAVHIEVQQRPDADMAGRMAEYAVRLLRRRVEGDLPTDMIQAVLQVTGRPMDVVFRRGPLCNSPRLLHLPTMPVQWLLDTPGLMPFALVNGGVAAVGPVVDRIARAGDPERQTSLVALAIQLVPALGDAIIDNLRRACMTDVIAELRKTHWGRGLQQEGREEMLEQILMARFPEADPTAIVRTAARLLDQHGLAAGSVALTIPGPDPVRQP